MAAPRGIRNRNPGNVEYNPKVKWAGLADPPSDGRFCRFKEDVFGLRALATVLRNYRRKHGLRTIAQIVNRWAPPTENNTRAYQLQVAVAFNATPEYEPNLDDPAELITLTRAIVLHENGAKGSFDGDWYPDTVYADAVHMVLRPLAQTRTVQGAVVSGTATAAQGLLQVVTENLDQAQQVSAVFDVAWPEIARYVLLAVALAGIAYTVYARYSDRKEGRR